MPFCRYEIAFVVKNVIKKIITIFRYFQFIQGIVRMI